LPTISGSFPPGEISCRQFPAAFPPGGILAGENKNVNSIIFALSLQRFICGVLMGISTPYKNQNRQNSF
jgi:hypothetical protein